MMSGKKTLWSPGLRRLVGVRRTPRMRYDDAESLRRSFADVYSAIVDEPAILAREMRRARAVRQQRAFREARERRERVEESSVGLGGASRRTVPLGDVAARLIGGVREREHLDALARLIAENPDLGAVESVLRDFLVGRRK